MNCCFRSRAIRCRENPCGPLTARTWLIGLCPVWDPIKIPHDPVRLSTSLLWSQNIVRSPCRKVVQAQLSATGSTAIWHPYGSKNLRKNYGLAWYVVGLPTGSLVFGPWAARELDVTDAFGWFRTDFPRTIDSYDTQPSPWERERRQRR